MMESLLTGIAYLLIESPEQAIQSFMVSETMSVQALSCAQSQRIGEG